MYFSRHHVLTSTDIDELRGELGKLFTPHQLDITKRNSRLNSRVYSCAVNNLWLSCFSYGENSPIRAAVSEEQCSEVVSVNFLMAGSGHLAQHRELAEISTNQGLVINMNKPFKLDLLGYTGAALVFDHDTLRRHARSLFGDKAGDAELHLSTGIDLTKPEGRALKRAVHYAIREMDGELGELNNPISLTNLENYLLTQFLTLHPSRFTELAESPPERRVMPRHIKRALDYVHSHAHEKITLEELAVYAGCSYRSLQNQFAKVLGMSPMEYLRDVRLAGVRDDLLNEDNQQLTVSEIGKRWGFIHMGRLSRMYRNKFGVLPSETLNRKKI